MLLTSFACCAVIPSEYWTSAWNWLFLVKVMIFKTVPNFEKIWEGGKTSNAIIVITLFNNIIQFIKEYNIFSISFDGQSQYLVKDIKSNRVEEVFNDYSQHRALAPHACSINSAQRHASCLDCIHRLQCSLCSLWEWRGQGTSMHYHSWKNDLYWVITLD